MNPAWRTEARPLDRLKQVLAQDSLELFFPEERTIGLIYLMNDTAESYFLFQNARMTGIYDPEYDGSLEAELSREEQGYSLMVYQGKQALTIFFEDFYLETCLYNYGEIGHFWIKEYEYLRQLEFRLAILHDKLEYLGEAYCTRDEIRLASLQEFPPLNYHCYPAVPAAYRSHTEEDWYVSKEAIHEMLLLAREAGDRSMVRCLKLYQKIPGKWMAKRIAAMLSKKKHADLIDLLFRKTMEAAAVYPNRSFSKEQQIICDRLMTKANVRCKQLEKEGTDCLVLRQEPFCLQQDDLKFEAYVMIWQEKGSERTVAVETIKE